MAKWRFSKWWLLVVVALVLAAVAVPRLKWVTWIWPVTPFNLVGPVDYVGSRGLGAYLVHTSAGAILIDATLDHNVAMIERNIQARGVPLRQVKLILLSHAHFDHAGGLARLQQATGAQVIVGARDRDAVETGVPPGETSYGVIRFAPVKVDRAVRDGDTVTLGGVTLTAVSTPGHTPGCTSWMMRVPVAGKPETVLFTGSLEVAGNKLVGNRRYPEIVKDFRQTFQRLARMHVDVTLPFHPERADLLPRAWRGQVIDPTIFPNLVSKAARDFEVELKRQEHGA